MYPKPAYDVAILEIQEKGEDTKILILIDSGVTVPLPQEAEEHSSLRSEHKVSFIR